MIWTCEFVKEYLQQYKLPNDITITIEPWPKFFEDVSKRYVNKDRISFKVGNPIETKSVPRLILIIIMRFYHLIFVDYFASS